MASEDNFGITEDGVTGLTCLETYGMSDGAGLNWFSPSSDKALLFQEEVDCAQAAISYCAELGTEGSIAQYHLVVEVSSAERECCTSAPEEECEPTAWTDAE
jgi:hypothetical protein